MALSAPTKPDSEKKHNRTISLDRETSDYADRYLRPFSPWVRGQIRKDMACNHGYIKLTAAENAVRLQVEAEEAARTFKDKYGIEAHEGRAEAIKAMDQAEALEQARRKAAEDKRYAEIWTRIKDKKPHQAVAWLHSRSKEYGFEGNPVDTYDKVRAWAEQSGAG